MTRIPAVLLVLAAPALALAPVGAPAAAPLLAVLAGIGLAADHQLRLRRKRAPKALRVRRD